MASSTTSPIASTRPKSERVFSVKPKIGKNAKVPISATGTAQQRNERGAPALQKNKNDDDDENQRDDQRAHDVVHALGNGERGVERNDVVQVGGKTLLEFCHEFEHGLFIIERVGVGQLVNRQDRRRLAVQFADDVVKLRAEFHAGDVFQAHDRAVRIFADDDVAKFFLGNEPALRGDGIGEFLPVRRRRAAHQPGGIGRILRVDGGDDVIDREVEFRESGRA